LRKAFEHCDVQAFNFAARLRRTTAMPSSVSALQFHFRHSTLLFSFTLLSAVGDGSASLVVVAVQYARLSLEPSVITLLPLVEGSNDFFASFRFSLACRKLIPRA
jgi:hypothetical protein